jgi:uncharacterized cupin superfamily protein
VRSDHSSDRTVVPEASLEQTEHGLVPTGAGWFVLNARDARWRDRGQGGAYCGFEGEPQFEQIGINLVVLGPGQPMAMYHWEDDQEDFLVLRGEALLIVEGEERPLTQWDLVHCPPRTNHVIVGAGGAPCVILAVGSRAADEGSGAYTVDAAAVRHGAGVERETRSSAEAYARFPKSVPSAYRDGWLPA